MATSWVSWEDTEQAARRWGLREGAEESRAQRARGVLCRAGHQELCLLMQ